MRRVLLALALGAATSFAPIARGRAVATPRRAADEVMCGECDDWNPFGDGCKPCADGRSVFVGDTRVSSKTLRDVEVVAASSGARTSLDGLMGSGSSVVVFLRHLG
mmetsp:Transcript_15592/g.48327  ORF Transcript_15592/g.48327 Transcript_15592/m.48327 type:complete len:106 (+) Transcript_15592:437-754(+)